MAVIQIGCAQRGLPNWVQQIVTGAIIVLGGRARSVATEAGNVLMTRPDMIITDLRRPRSPLPDVAHAGRHRRDALRIPTTPPPTSSFERTDGTSKGTASTFTIGRGNEVCARRSRPSAITSSVRTLDDHHQRLRRVLASAGERLAAALARSRERRHPPRARGDRQRRLGSLRQGQNGSRCGSCSPT